jgi:hypothetical protein
MEGILKSPHCPRTMNPLHGAPVRHLLRRSMSTAAGLTLCRQKICRYVITNGMWLITFASPFFACEICTGGQGQYTSYYCQGDHFIFIFGTGFDIRPHEPIDLARPFYENFLRTTRFEKPIQFATQILVLKPTSRDVTLPRQ